MSVDNSRSCSSSKEDTAGLLEGVGSAVVSLTCCALRKSRQLPCFVGPMIGAVEDTLSPLIQPLAVKAGTEGLYLLSLADLKLYALGEIAVEKAPFLSGFCSHAKGVQSMFVQFATVTSYAYEQFCELGILGGAANTWVKYEVMVKSKSADTLKFVHRLPLLGAFVPVIYTVGTPIASAIVSWLVKHSEDEDRHFDFHEVHLPDDDSNSKVSLDGKPLFVVDNGAEDGSRTDAQNSNSEDDSADRCLSPESSESVAHTEIVQKSDLFEEVGGAESVDNGTGDKGKSIVTTVAPVSIDEDSDDELSVLFDAGWSVGKLRTRKISVESKASRKGWW